MNVFVLFGQTATGKSAKALELTATHNGEIVNFDSRQIYKKLDIITGKDIAKSSRFKVQSLTKEKYEIGYYELSSSAFQHSAKVWLYDIVDPKIPFSSSDYCTIAESVIKDIIGRGKTPILVGGTGYYLRHLLFGTPNIGVQENWDLRKSLQGKTIEELQSILEKENKQLLVELNNSDRNNSQRLIRRIEIAQAGLTSLPPHNTQETLTSRLTHLRGVQEAVSISYLPFFHLNQEIAHEKITLRVEQRIEQGALEEVHKLLDEGYRATDPGLNALGYRQLIAYHNNELSLTEAKRQWATKEVQYAKRQRTYFKKYFIAS